MTFLKVMSMTRNAILDELHAARRQLLANYNGDTAAYLRDAQARLEASGRPIAQRKQRTLRRNPGAKSIEMALENPSSPPGDR
jgi:hypothetical protein